MKEQEQRGVVVAVPGDGLFHAVARYGARTGEGASSGGCGRQPACQKQRRSYPEILSFLGSVPLHFLDFPVCRPLRQTAGSADIRAAYW